MPSLRNVLPSLGFALSVSVTAQAGDAAIAACADIEDQSIRIECLEAAIRVLTADEASEVTGTGSTGSPSAAGEPRDSPAAGPGADPQVSVPAPVAGEARVAGEAEKTPAERPAERPASAQDTEPAGTEGQAQPVSQLGADQVRARSESREERLARLQSASGLRVADYSTVPFRRLQVELENGQIWRQIQGDTQRIRVSLNRNQTVDIEESALGGFKLRLNEIKRTIRVQRIR